jgi:hypothetical protein
LGRGKRGRVLATSSPLPDPLPTGEGDKSFIEIAGHISKLHFKLESTIFHFSFAIANPPVWFE